MRDLVGIPNWNFQNVLPPIDPTDSGGDNRSPYPVRLLDVVEEMGTSSERILILEGFLRHRAGLHAAGLVDGFQWLDGSFMEHIEEIERRPPRDLDVVTFYEMPAGMTQKSIPKELYHLFDPRFSQSRYFVDAYFVQLDTQLTREAVRILSYWQSMWSHRRDGRPKGFLQVELSPSEDPEAWEALELLKASQ